MEKTVVDFSKLPEKVLEEYEIEVFDSYKDVFYSLYLDDDSFSLYSLIDTLGDKSIPEFISNEPYLYECGNKLYRWVYATEYMDELVTKYPDAVVSGRFNNKEDDKGMTAKGALKILSYNNAKLALDLCGYGQVISDKQLDELKNVIISALQAQADKENNATILSYVEQAALFIKKNSGVAWEIFKLIEKENHREDIIGKLEEHGLTDIPDVEIDRLVETFESALSKNDGYYEAFWASADYVIDEFEKEKVIFSKGFTAKATLTDGQKEWDVVIYSHYSSYEKALKGIERFSSQGYDVVKTWIEPNDILQEILDVAKKELNENDAIGYTMPDGKHHIYIFVDDSLKFADGSKTREDGFYEIEPNRVVDGAMEPMGENVTADYGDFDELRKGIQWCLKQFAADKEASLDSVLNNAVVRSEEEQKNALVVEKVKDTMNFEM